MICFPVEQLHSRADALFTKFEEGEGTRYMVEAIDLDRQALELCPPGHHMRFLSLTCLALHLVRRFNELGAAEDREEAIILSREGLNLCPAGHPARSMYLNTLVAGLISRYEALEALEDLEEVIVLEREALNRCPQGDPDDRSTCLNNLAAHLFSRYQRLETIEDLDGAIVLYREMLDLYPRGQSDRSTPLDNLATHLFFRYERLWRIEDINEAIVLDQEALDLRPRGHSDRSASLNTLAIHLFTRYKQLGAMDDLNTAIDLHREVLDLRPQGHPHRSMSLNDLAAYVFIRYRQLGAIDDLNEAIVLHQEALDLRPQGHPYRSMSLTNHAANLSTRYQQFGKIEDLEEAIVLTREAVGLFPPGHPDRSTPLENLAVYLSMRNKQLGAMEDLDEAILIHREAFDLRPKGHPDRSTSLSNLAVDLCSRYRQLGAMQDLEEAIVLDREALDLRPQGHPDRSMSLNNLALHLHSRYKQLEAIEDLEGAIDLDREALSLQPPGYPDRPNCLNNLARHLFSRYQQVGEMQGLSEAITLNREALDLLPQGHPLRITCMDDLGVYLSIRGHQLEATEDLDEAIVLGRDALALSLIGHCNWSERFYNLTGYLFNRLTRSRQEQDKEELFSLYPQLVHLPKITSPYDLRAAESWISIAEDFQHPTLLLAYETFFQLLVQYIATLPSLPPHNAIPQNLTSSLAADAFSACLRAGTPARAVELLEQGRGGFWNLLRLCPPLDGVVASGPVLFSDLQRAASGGPVIIVNASQYSCDALVVLLDRDPIHIPLQITQQSVQDLSKELHRLTLCTKDDVTRELISFLRNLWDQVVSPIVDVLQPIHPSQSRIWWYPTGEFSQLPLHAAGPRSEGQQNLPDLYISSYTPTLTALIRARRRDPSTSATERTRLVAIGHAKADGHGDLHSVDAELDSIGRSVDGRVTFTRMDGEESCVSRVVEELGKNEWVHFACHGLANREEPCESALALHDGGLTLQRIMACDLKNHEFAYVSARRTTVEEDSEEDSADKIHLASAIQFAGFPSVIGTMWAVGDDEMSKVAAMFYKHMVDESSRLDYTQAALMLNKTIKSVNIPFEQRISYIHFGA